MASARPSRTRWRRPATGSRCTPAGTPTPPSGCAQALPGSGHLVVAGDLTDPDTCARLVAEVVDGLGELDVLVNNAGVFTAHPIAATGYADWQQAWRDTVELNLLAPANLAWLAVDHLLHRAGRPGRRPADQRRLPRRVPRRAGHPRLRREQGRAARHDPVAGGRPGTARHPGRRGGAGLRRHRDGPRRAGRPGRRRGAGPEPVRPGRHARRDRRGRWRGWPPTRRCGSAAPSSTPTARPTCAERGQPAATRPDNQPPGQPNRPPARNARRPARDLRCGQLLYWWNCVPAGRVWRLSRPTRRTPRAAR